MTRLPASRVPDPMDAPPVRWGILGAGSIAGAFTYAVRHGTRGSVTVVGSRDQGRADAFAAEHGVGRGVGSYAELVAADDVDIVYVASPHSEHHEHALLALTAGKPVLVEKSFTRNAPEAREVVQTARERGLLCIEAMWSRFLPHYDIVRQIVANGQLGTIRSVAADHGQPLWPDGPRRLSDPELAGGALLDLGIYPVSFAHLVLGSLTGLRAQGTLTPEGVDLTTSVLATNSAGAHAVLSTTMGAKTPTTALIAGDKGRVEIAGEFYQPNSVVLRGPNGEEIDRWDPPANEPHGFRYEAAEAARCLHEGRTETDYLPLDDTIAIMTVMDEIRAQIGVRYPGEAPLPATA